HDLAPAIDRLASAGPTPEDEASHDEIREVAARAVRDAVAVLDERERMIVRARLMTEDPPTPQELGAKLGVSKERVRQTEARARTKLRGELAELADLVA